jgi:hypothetical protein
MNRIAREVERLEVEISKVEIQSKVGVTEIHEKCCRMNPMVYLKLRKRQSVNSTIHQKFKCTLSENKSMIPVLILNRLVLD